MTQKYKKISYTPKKIKNKLKKVIKYFFNGKKQGFMGKKNIIYWGLYFSLLRSVL
jgi:hypothetical protein